MNDRICRSQLIVRSCAFSLLLLVGCTAESDRVERDTSAGQQQDQRQSTAELPDNFPSEFPMPPDFRITEAQFAEGDAFTQPNFLVRGISDSGVYDLATFYHERLPAAGYEVQSDPPSPDQDQAVVYFHGDAFRDASVQLSREQAATNVLISLPVRD